MADKVAHSALINLSRTCTLFYNTLSPHLFESVTLRNTVQSAAAIEFLSTTGRRAHVKTLHFQAEGPGDRDDNHNDVGGVFPEETSALLCNLRKFPKVETLIVDFMFHLGDHSIRDHWGDTIGSMVEDEEDETPETIEQKEMGEACRALMVKTLRAISVNQNKGAVQTLEVRMCPLWAVSALGTQQLNEWLATLSAFRFEIDAGDTGRGWYVMFLVLNANVGNIVRHARRRCEPS